MVVYVVINRIIVDKEEKLNIIGVYTDRRFAMEQYEEYVNNGQYNIIAMVVGQTVLNVEV